MKTYVFNFYNLYLPKEVKFQNKRFQIRITPLELSKEFEKNRKNISKPHYRGGWKTAKCFIKSYAENEAIQIAEYIEFIYSFAQKRNIFFLSHYKYSKGQKFSTFQSKYIDPITNQNFDLVYGTKTKNCTYTRDISKFFNISIQKLSSLNFNDSKIIISTIHAYSISHTNIVTELKFLICWAALEKLANQHYIKHKSHKSLFSKKEKEQIRDEIINLFNSNYGNDPRLKKLIRNFSKNYLFEHSTSQKIRYYLEYINCGFNKVKLGKMLNKLSDVRNDLIHSLKSDIYYNEPQLLSYLRKILEIVILRILGINEENQEELILNQYNLGNDI